MTRGSCCGHPATSSPLAELLDGRSHTGPAVALWNGVAVSRPQRHFNIELRVSPTAVPSMTESSAPTRHLRLLDAPARGATTTTLIEEARALDKLGHRAEARAQYEAALRSLAAPSPSMASMLMRWIARTYEVDADYRAAEDCATAAVAAAEVAEDRNALGHALNVLAAVRWRQGDLDHAAQLFQEALERGTTTTDPRLQVDVMTNLGTMAGIRGDFREALRFFQEALSHGRLHSLLDN